MTPISRPDIIPRIIFTRETRMELSRRLSPQGPTFQSSKEEINYEPHFIILKRTGIRDIFNTFALVEEELAQLGHGVGGVFNGMPLNLRMTKNLIIIPTRRRLIPKEMHRRKPFSLQMSQTKSFIPSFGEDINGYLPTNGELQPISIEAGTQLLHQFCTDTFFGVESGKG